MQKIKTCKKYKQSEIAENANMQKNAKVKI